MMSGWKMLKILGGYFWREKSLRLFVSYVEHIVQSSINSNIFFCLHLSASVFWYLLYVF